MLTTQEIQGRAQAALPKGYTAGAVEKNSRGDTCVLINGKDGKPWLEMDAPQLTVDTESGKVAWIDPMTEEPRQSPFRPAS